jgi:hypothetical protein
MKQGKQLLLTHNRIARNYTNLLISGELLDIDNLSCLI